MYADPWCKEIDGVLRKESLVQGQGKRQFFADCFFEQAGRTLCVWLEEEAQRGLPVN